MIKQKINKILSFNGVSLIIGILGSLASILTVFITKWDVIISLKWLVFVLFLTLTLSLLFIKLVYELNEEIKIKRITKFPVLRYIPDSKIFLTQPNDALGYSAMVSIFYLDDSYEVELGKGYVNNIQDNFIQIKILDLSSEFKTGHEDILSKMANNDLNILKKIIVKSYVTYTN